MGVRGIEGNLKLWFPVAIFSLLWLDLCRLLSSQWESREQYAYGWFVPVFAAILLWRRWTDRPVVAPDQEGDSMPRSTASFLLAGVMLLLTLSFLPLRVLYEINLDWPLLSWLYAGIVVAATLYAFFLAGGQTWVKHFAFPVALILVAVVWPYRIEKGLTQGLMRVVANVTVELLGWIDIPALQRGNLIELSTGTLGVDEACSGVRSFQSSLMAALVMGELYRFRFIPRLALVLCGITLGFCFNVVRTLLLSWQANANGLSAVDKWHDPAGMTIAVACFFSLWVLAILIRRWTSEPDSVSRDHSASRLGSVPRRYLLALGLWSLACVGATEAWYRLHASKSDSGPRWSAVLPTNNATFKAIQLPPRSVRLLQNDSGATGSWGEGDGSEWTAFFLRWNATSASSIFRARQHRPDVCLPASGLSLVEDGGLELFKAQQFTLPFHKYTYQSGGTVLYVFFCQWEDGAKRQSGLANTEQGGRIKAAWDGHRVLGQQNLELILTGYHSLAEAAEAVRKRLPALIVTQTSSPSPG